MSARTTPEGLPPGAGPAAPAGLPRLLAGIEPDGAPLGLAAHLDVYGELPFARTRARTHTRPRMARKGDTTAADPFQHWHDPADLVDLITRSGLRGRGGGAFPTGEKLRAVASARARAHTPAVVLVNGAEGEPASAKDRTLLETLPHLVLDGAVLAAQAVGAEEIVLAVCECADAACNAAAVALAERGHDAAAVAFAERGHDATAVTLGERGHDASAVAERAGRSDLPGGRGRGRLAAGAMARRREGEPPVRSLPVPARYVAGQESALVNLANGGPALPTFTPPYPFERGVRRRPTLVANVETLAHLALIARHGADWFRELGSASQPGSALLTVSGVQLADPGVYEVEVGSPLSALLDAAGGVRERPRAVLFGGYAGTWIDGAHLHGVALGDEQLAPYGATLGAGVVALLSPNACPVAELARVTRWLAAQSARQCGPCTFGLPTLADTVEQVALGRAPRHPERRLEQLASLVYQRGGCSHPDGAARLLSSALHVFAEELADHAQHGPCAACERPSELPRPRAASNVDDRPSAGRTRAGRTRARAAAAGRGWRTAHADHELAGMR